MSGGDDLGRSGMNFECSFEVGFADYPYKLGVRLVLALFGGEVFDIRDDFIEVRSVGLGDVQADLGDFLGLEFEAEGSNSGE